MTTLKLGKRPAARDDRTLRLSDVLVELPAVPPEYSYEAAHDVNLPTPMFANDRYGDCVIAGRAHLTLRFEHFEQGQVLDISDRDVLHEYFREGGANFLNPRPDRGLVMLNSLKLWRKCGWIVNGKRYYIYAFAGVNHLNYDLIRAAIYLFGGVTFGLALPKSAETQFRRGETWDIVSGEDGIRGSLGGHCVMSSDYTRDGLIDRTWGRPQLMAWRYLDAYCDECYAVVDARNRWLGDKSPLDLARLDSYLQALAG